MDEWRRDIRTGAFDTHYLEVGGGKPVIFLHGSGPGVSALANWRFQLPVLGEDRWALAPDLVGFGRTRHPDGPGPMDVTRWVRQVIDFADALDIERFDVVGNSMGGAIVLRLAVDHPERLDRVVTMGTIGVPFTITETLDGAWGYTPDLEDMQRIIGWFAWDQGYAADDALVRLRHETSLEPTSRASYEAMFPAPRQAILDACVVADEALAAIPHPLLAVHGGNDRIIPLETSLHVARVVPNSRLTVFNQCGHWVQIERKVEFSQLIRHFLSTPLDAPVTRVEPTPVGANG